MPEPTETPPRDYGVAPRGFRLPDATRRLTSGERRADGIATLVFLLVAGGMVLGLPGGPPQDWTQAAALVCGLALLARILVQIGSGFMVPTQLLFVPLLLLTRRRRHAP